MAKKEKKILKHPFYDRHTVLGAVVITIIGMMIAQLLVAGIINGIYVVITGSAEKVSTTAVGLGSTLGAIAALAFFRRWFYPEYEGAFKGGERVPFWILFTLPILAFCLIGSFIVLGDRLGIPPFANLIAALAAGVCEEAIFRGMTVSYLMRQWGDRKKLIPVILLSSVIFGMSHITNIATGAPVVMTLRQIVTSFIMGLFLCALYLRSGSLIPPMFIHFLYDIIAFMDVSKMQEGGTYNKTASTTVPERIFQLIISIIFLALAVYLTRPAVREDIYRIWRKKWGKQAE